jgi:tripartite-type tricarboxylate transporter receptor subunit TctC
MTKLPRRQFLHLAAGAAALPAVSRIASAQAYPTRPVRIVVGFAAGSSSDILARLIGQRLSERLGQPVIIENRPGAGGSIGAESVVRATPDGHTLLLCASADAVNATIYDNLKFNFVREIAPVASIARAPLVFVVHPSFPAKTVPEFIVYAKANPGKVTFGSAGIGTVAQMAGELFKVTAEIDLTHVPYRGLAPALTDLLGGQVQAIFSTTPPAIAHIRAGRLRGLAVTSAMRDEALLDLPTVGDFLPGYETTLMSGLCAPSLTPAEIVERLNGEIIAVLADTETKARLAELGNVPLAMTPADFGKLIADETERWAKVIRKANIKAQ